MDNFVKIGSQNTLTDLVYVEKWKRHVLFAYNRTSQCMTHFKQAVSELNAAVWYELP